MVSPSFLKRFGEETGIRLRRFHQIWTGDRSEHVKAIQTSDVVRGVVTPKHCIRIGSCSFVHESCVRGLVRRSRSRLSSPYRLDENRLDYLLVHCGERVEVIFIYKYRDVVIYLF